MNEWIEKIQQLNWKQADRAAPILLVLLILYLCWKLASIFWLLVAPPQVMQVERIALGSQQAQVPNIAAFALFQEVGVTAAADESANLLLQGVMVGYPSQFSSAVIKMNEVADRYRVGENIANTSYQLAEVYWDRVLLRQNNGTTRELKFKGIENGLDQSIVQPVANASSSFNNQATQMPQSQEQNALGQAVQKIQQDREQYLKDMGVNAGGEGYEVTSRTPTALRSKLGLQPGDRIMSLNGQAVGQGQSDAQLLEQARREGQVKIEIKRGDQVMTIQQDF
ncbi:general secretion pathway protein [Acinetobacter bohemicus]|jgi:general secretion pathway protein C|uniref:General secretion pathway protein C n=1 Tax=Acinetobacter bohemicus TaxID=1435036 RepID=A0A1I6UJX2_9GAMM|nr:type II secretion system protein N [Acinetobacter bohemicus]KAB0654347.1 general secretion pathway protein [Acinetobacter bohemicus]SFT01728.1 general secretion pathway protein C [Acinetobacter bohemicus]